MSKMIVAILACVLLQGSYTSMNAQEPDMYRPKFHFTPKANWMNDPNGLYYKDGVYHLFFQYYPDGVKWGPMHWGHASTTDLVSWKEHSIALYPDSLGYIFSGSAVVDKNNTSGFGKDGKIPIVAIFTHHDPKGDIEKRNNYQVQSLAYSLDDGMTWTKYAGNPVIKNPGIVDFRDPKVMWYEDSKEWIMALATKDRITFYASKNLKEWNRMSDFGEKAGAHGGVWECPDLFPMNYNGKKKWVLFVSINPGAPNRGSGTQYFVGDFDGKVFTPGDTLTRWIDWGTDNYAGVTFFNTGNRRIFLGWMSNWQYGEKVPTSPWRSAMTLPRVLELKESGGKPYLTSWPVKEVGSLYGRTTAHKVRAGKKNYLLGETKDGLFQLHIGSMLANDFSIVLSNSKGEEMVIGYEKSTNRYYMDRTKSGQVSFEEGFAKRHYSPRISNKKMISFRLIADVASVELFADDGLSVMTEIFFSNAPLTKVNFRSPAPSSITDVQFTPLDGSLYQ